MNRTKWDDFDYNSYDDDDNKDYRPPNQFFFWETGCTTFYGSDTDGDFNNNVLQRAPRVRMPSTKWVLNASGPGDPHVVTSVGPRQIAKLAGRTWKNLPEKILFKVLVWLPPAAQARFRCVNSKWAVVLSSRTPFLPTRSLGSWNPSLTVKSNARARRVSAYCHSENRWFDIPCIVAKSVKGKLGDMMTEGSKATKKLVQKHQKIREDGLLNIVRAYKFRWTLADVDGELFCYRSDDEKKESNTEWYVRIWIAVCNPMIPGSERRLPPIYTQSVRLMKLLVDRETRTFKVVVISWGMLAIFDSVRSDWALHKFSDGHGSPPRCTRSFVWKGVICFCSFDYEAFVYILDVASGTWSRVDLDKTDLSNADAEEAGKKTPVFDERRVWLIGSNDQVRLIHVDLESKDIIRVWKMAHRVSVNGHLFTSAAWEREAIELPRAIKNLAVEFRDCVSHGGEYMCFNGGKTNQWIKYTFSTQTWQLMPCRGKRVAVLKWRHCVPGLEIDLQ